MPMVVLLVSSVLKQIAVMQIAEKLKNAIMGNEFLGIFTPINAAKTGIATNGVEKALTPHIMT